MTVTFEISNSEEMEQLVSFFKIAKPDDIKVVSALKPKIKKGNKSLNPKELFGIWQDNPKNIEEIRTNAWQRK
jgi:hypothetical protein